MVNFGPPAAEIGLPVWGIPAHFNGFRVLAAILHFTLVVGVSQTAALNRGRHLYSAGRPSHWALVHILVFYLISYLLVGWSSAVVSLLLSFTFILGLGYIYMRRISRDLCESEQFFPHS